MVVIPNIQLLQQLIDSVKHIVFPGYFSTCPDEPHMFECYMSSEMAQLRSALCQQMAANQAEQFLTQLPEIGRLLGTDVDAMLQNDPAVDNRDEIIFCYPVVQAMLHYRVAHLLLQLGVPIIPRILTEMAHSATGIDIHPSAQIGEYFAIDHGTGVVIGATCIIGNHVTLYQGVTLGAKNFHRDTSGNLLSEPRHPILEDNVTVYSNASILGRVRIGHDSVIGGNVWLTHDVEPHSQIVQKS